ncbi:MAG TPA: HEAT repeat domain-containing protein [Planctomycetaceae bacterium]|jgi:hypothetical protein
MLDRTVTPTNLDEYAAHYLDRLCDDENAYFALIEAPCDILSHLATAFRSEIDGAKRAKILNVIWQHRDASTVPLIGEALHDESPLVWKQALDGLVAIGAPACVVAIRAAHGRPFKREADQRTFREFLNEALEQLQPDSSGDVNPSGVEM